MKTLLSNIFLFLTLFSLSSLALPSISFAQLEDEDFEITDKDEDFDIDEFIDEAAKEDPDLADITEEDSDDDSSDFDEYAIEEEIENLRSPKESEPLYRPSKSQRVSKKGRGRYIYHPNQKKGLFKIDRDGNYYYKIDSSKRKAAFSLRGGVANFKNFQDPNTGLTYSDIYGGDTATSLNFDWEWKPFKKFKTLSIKFASGFIYDRGKGKLFDEATGMVDGDAQESYTLIYLPNTVGATYRFRQYYKQLFVPFITGGLDYHIATELRDDFNRTKFLGIPAAHFGGGVDINLGWLERMADIELDREFGINNTYFSLELRQIVAFNSDRDIANTMFVAGFHFEY